MRAPFNRGLFSLLNPIYHTVPRGGGLIARASFPLEGSNSQAARYLMLKVGGVLSHEGFTLTQFAIWLGYVGGLVTS